jgi:hypothetical protein
MAISTFDTLKFVRRLEAAGVPAQQAEVQAEVPTEAFNVNLDALMADRAEVAELIGRDPVSRVVTADGKEQITGVRHYWRVYQRNIPEY